MVVVVVVVVVVSDSSSRVLFVTVPGWCNKQFVDCRLSSCHGYVHRD